MMSCAKSRRSTWRHLHRILPNQMSLIGADVGFAVAVTFILSVSVIERWHAYRLFDKCFSVLFLLIVLTLPWEGIRMKKRTRSLKFGTCAFC